MRDSVTLVVAALSELCIRVLWLPSDGKKRRLIFSQLLIQRVQDGFSGLDWPIGCRISYPYLPLDISVSGSLPPLVAGRYCGSRQCHVGNTPGHWLIIVSRGFKHGLQFER